MFPNFHRIMRNETFFTDPNILSLCVDDYSFLEIKAWSVLHNSIELAEENFKIYSKHRAYVLRKIEGYRLDWIEYQRQRNEEERNALATTP